MKTDVAGRFILDTILPGHYPDMTVPAHVHFSLWGAGEFSPIRPLERRPGGELHCSLKIRLKTETNFR